jgi:DeoR/GlpR family transcriptional regulator of sugar metabolism
MATELAIQLGTTESTIRRDLRFLANQGLCKRIHGGALHLVPSTGTHFALCTNDKTEAMAAYPFMPSESVDYLACSPNNSTLKSYFGQLNCKVITSNNF